MHLVRLELAPCRKYSSLSGADLKKVDGGLKLISKSPFYYPDHIKRLQGKYPLGVRHSQGGIIYECKQRPWRIFYYLMEAGPDDGQVDGVAVVVEITRRTTTTFKKR